MVSMFFNTSAAGAIISLLWAGIQIIGVVVARLLVHVLVDIPDIALHTLARSLKGTALSFSEVCASIAA